MKLQKSFFLHSELDDYPFVTNNGLKGQQAHSPGQRPGYNSSIVRALQGQKRFMLNAFALAGRLPSHLPPRALPRANCSLSLRSVIS